MQNQSIFVSSNTQLVTSLNIAQKQLHYEVPATRNTRSPPTLTSHVKACFWGKTVNISQLNVYYGDGQVEK
ncbi:hypothetical protein DPMN_172514 [Dreissena polymorpha]|uniref:Uncharacterized protein n=1 Tax=Dreissena polymorpha TaxID=45954 RepID=A0A9D4E334_DREPO|nr:hypothetical protein DPMN_172514 [Dreissena polymorpha]